MKTITLQEALRQPRVLIVPVYEDDAVPASICDALGYDFAHEETGKEGKIQRLSTLGRIAVPTLIFAGLGRRAEITYGQALSGQRPVCLRRGMLRMDGQHGLRQARSA